MAGFVTRQHVRHIAKVYGWRVAAKAIITRQPTFLQFLQSEGLI